MIVVDTSVLAPLFIPGDSTADIQRVLQKDPEWIAPPLWRSELRNVLATQMRVRKLPLKVAVDVMSEAEELMLESEFEPSSEIVLRLAYQTGATAYDCEFVALAQLFDRPLVTQDRELITVFPETAMTVAEWLAS